MRRIWVCSTPSQAVATLHPNDVTLEVLPVSYIQMHTSYHFVIVVFCCYISFDSSIPTRSAVHSYTAYLHHQPLDFNEKKWLPFSSRICSHGYNNDCPAKLDLGVIFLFSGMVLIGLRIDFHWDHSLFCDGLFPHGSNIYVITCPSSQFY